MNRIIAVAVVVCLTSISVFAANETKFRKSKRPAPGRYIIALEPGTLPLDERVAAMARQFGGEVHHIFRGEPWEGFSVSGLPEVAAIALSRDPRVRIVEEDGVAEAAQAAPQHSDWARDRTNQRTLPLDASTTSGCYGASSTNLYIVDTGINDPNQTEFGTRLQHAYKDPLYGDYEDKLYPYGHGTAVASIAAGTTKGVAYQAKVWNVKVHGTQYGSASMAAAGIRWINAHAVTGPKIVNMSLAYPVATDGGVTLLEQDIAASVASYGITFVVAAGQDNVNGIGQNTCSVVSPGRMGTTDGVITTGASYLTSTATGLHAADSRSVHLSGDGVAATWASNYGSCVDIFAPGTRVAAMNKAGNAFEFSGTSAAAPHVAGIAARIANIHWTSYSTLKTPADVEATVKTDATPGVLDSSIGSGSPNLLAWRFFFKCRA